MSIWFNMLIDALEHRDDNAYKRLMRGDHENDIEVEAGSVAALVHHLDNHDDYKVKQWLHGNINEHEKIIIQQRQRYRH